MHISATESPPNLLRRAVYCLDGIPLTREFAVGSPNVKATERKDEVAIPEAALRPSMEGENFHTGRGGKGNVHLAEPDAPKHPVGLADKLKNKLFKKKAEKELATA